MAKVAIRFAESALADLESIRDWYADQDVPEVGERLIGEIVASIEALADHPDMGRIVPEFDQPFLRELYARRFAPSNHAIPSGRGFSCLPRINEKGATLRRPLFR
jgi:plasmid stabilization system protein ParE